MWLKEKTKSAKWIIVCCKSGHSYPKDDKAEPTNLDLNMTHSPHFSLSYTLQVTSVSKCTGDRQRR